MKTSKLLISSLLAAAAMSVPAYGVTTTTTTLDDVTYSGTIWTTNVSGVSSGTSLSNSGRSYSDGTNTRAGNVQITGVGNFYNYFFNTSETQYVGNTLRLTGATQNHTVTTDWGNYAWFGGLITDACDYTYTIGRSDTTIRLKGTAGVNMSINADTVIWGDKSNTSGPSGISVESDGSWVIATDKTLKLKSTTSATFAAGTTTTVSGGGTLSFTECANLILKGNLSVGESTMIDLSGSNVTLASAIQNSGTVSVTSDTTFNLSIPALRSMKNADGTFSVISGGNVSGWDTLSTSDFTFNGAAFSDGSLGRYSGFEVRPDGKITFTESAANLVWTNAADGTWDTSAQNWTNTSTGEADAFVSYDSVEFNKSGTYTVTVDSEGVTADIVKISSGTVSFSGGTITALGGVSVTGGTVSFTGIDVGSDASVSVTGSASISGEIVSMGAGSSLTLAGTTASSVTISGAVGGTTNATIDISNGSTVTYTNAANQALKANITISGEGSQFVMGISGGSADTLNYSGTTSVTVSDGGVLDLRDNRWTIQSSNTFTLDGGTIKGAGQGDNGALDFFSTNATSYLVTAKTNKDSFIEAAIRLRGGVNFATEAGANLTISGKISDYTSNNTITKSGTGNLIFSGSATFANLAISGGSVEVTGSGVLTTTVTSMAANTSLTLAGTGATKSAVTISGAVAEGAGIEVSNGNSVTLTVGNNAQNFAGNLTVTGEGSTFTQGGTGSSDQLKHSTTETNTIKISDGGMLDLNASRWTIKSGNKIILDGGNVTGTGQLQSAATETDPAKYYGVLDFNGTNTLTVKNTYNKESTISGPVRLSGTTTFDVQNDATLNITGRLAQNGGSLVKTGSGTLVLDLAADAVAVNQDFSNAVTLSEGKIVLKYSSALGTGTVTAAGSTGVNEVTLKVAEDSSGNALTIANNISVSADKTLILESANAGNKLTGNITGTSGALKLASGTLEIAGTSSLKLVKVGEGAVLKFSGETTSIVDTTDGALVDGGGKLVFSSGTATVSRIILNSWNDGATSTASALAEVSGGVVNVTSAKEHAISIGSGASKQSHTLTISGGVLNATAGTTTLGYSSAGTLAVTGGEANLKGIAFGESSASGTLEVSNARLNLGESGIEKKSGAGTGSVSFGEGATIGALDSWSSAANLGISLAGAVTFDTTKRVASDSGAATADTTGTTITLAGALSGSGTLTKVGAGTLKLTGDNSSFTGNVKLSAGTLEIGHSNALGSADPYRALNIIGTSELKLGGDLIVANNVVFDYSATEALTLTINAAADTELSGMLSSYAQNEIRKVGAGTLTLSGDNSYFSLGTISVEEGTILAKSANALGAVSEAGNNKLRLSGGKLEIGSGVTLAQTNIEIVLGEAYAKTDAAADVMKAAILGANDSTGKLAGAVTITVEAADAVALAAATEQTQKMYQIFDLSTISLDGTTVTFELGESLTNQGYTGYDFDANTGTLILTVPEPSAFGLLAGAGALALVAARRRRQKKA